MCATRSELPPNIGKMVGSGSWTFFLHRIRNVPSMDHKRRFVIIGNREIRSLKQLFLCITFSVPVCIIFMVPSGLNPNEIAPNGIALTELNPWDCTRTGLHPHGIAPAWDCTHTGLHPHGIAHARDCTLTELHPHEIAPTRIAPARNCTLTELHPTRYCTRTGFSRILCSTT